MNPSESHDTRKTLSQYFGFDSFRPHQETLVDSILSGKDSFGIMPTGGGKSLCYQLPAKILTGCAIVVSPLIALMKDQVDAANANGIRAAFLNSTLALHEAQAIEYEYRTGQLDLLYLAPERLSTSYTTQFLQQNPPSFFAIDEAHCISDWGHDFRPDYLYLSRLRELFPKTAIAAFTATATPQVAKDIEARLQLADATKVRASFDRKNLFYEIRSKRNWQSQLVDFVKARPNQSGIIYRTSRDSVEQTAALLQANGISAAAYHAGLEPALRAKTQEDFIRDNTTVMVATIAFGMGVDKADVRFVVHGDLPKNIESYYQETGRAGRDGDPSHCLLLYAPSDGYKIRYFIDKIADEEEKKRNTALLRHMENFASVPRCRRIALLHYFAETYPKESCDHCDYCISSYTETDATVDAQKILSAIRRTGGKFGAAHIAAIVAGANTAKIRQFGHEQLKTYGVGKDRRRAHWRSVLDALLAADKLSLSNGQYPVPQLNEAGADILFGRATFSMQTDTRVEPEKVERIKADRRNDDIPCHQGLFDHLREIRKEIADAQNVPPYIIFSNHSLRELAAYQPASKQELLAISGIGQNKADAYGPQFLAEILNYTSTNPEAKAEKRTLVAKPFAEIKPGLSETILSTYTCLKQGLSIQQIAEQRELSPITIENHIEKLILEGKAIDPDQFFNPEQKRLCLELFGEHGDSRLKPIFEAAEGKLSYAQVKIIRAMHATSQD